MGNVMDKLCEKLFDLHNDTPTCKTCKNYHCGSIKVYDTNANPPKWVEYNGICFQLATLQGIAEPIYVDDTYWCPNYIPIVGIQGSSDIKVCGAFCSSY